MSGLKGTNFKMFCVTKHKLRACEVIAMHCSQSIFISRLMRDYVCLSVTMCYLHV